MRVNGSDEVTQPGARSTEEDGLLNRAGGALAGFAVGETLGAASDGRSREDARAALSEAFPDFGTPGPAARELFTGLGGTVMRGPESEADLPVTDLPRWVARSVSVGVRCGADPVQTLVERVASALDPTDHNRMACSAAAAVAAAISAACDRATWAQCLSLGITAADAVESGSSARFESGPSVAARLAWAHALATRSKDDPMSVISLLVGTASVPQEAVPAAFAVVGVLALASQENETTLAPVDVIREACALGGRSTVIAALAGSLAGSLAGNGAFPAHMRCGLDISEAVASR